MTDATLATALTIPATIALTLISILILQAIRKGRKMSPPPGEPTPSLHLHRAKTQIRELKRDNEALSRENQRLHEELTQTKKDRLRTTEALKEARKNIQADSLAQVIANQTGSSAAEVRRVMAGGGVSTPEGEHLIDPLTPADKYRGTSIRYVRRIIEIEDDA